MTPREALREGTSVLKASRGAADTPVLDASLLLAAALGLDRGRLLALPESGPDADLDEERVVRYREYLRERSSGRPVALILGSKEFYGRSFLVDGRVLVPRPDTELLVEVALREGDSIVRRMATDGNAAARLGPRASREPRVHECCVGSGAVAVSLAAERPSWEVSGSDLSPGALELARANARALLDPGRPGGPLVLLEGDLLSTAPGPWDLILANPPYVASGEARRLAEAWGEPLLALDGGPDGLGPSRRLLPIAAERLAPGGVLLVEADPSQAAELAALFGGTGLEEIYTLCDLGGRARLTRGMKAWKSSTAG